MATYKAIKGVTIQDLSSDPSPLISGDVWYNSTAEAIKAAPAGSWGSGGNMPGTQVGMGGGGTRDAAWSASGAPSLTATLFYNGTAWTDQSAAIANTTSSYLGSTGTQAAAVIAGGTPPGAGAGEWGGSSWTSITAMPTDRESIAGFGTATTATMCGGTTFPTVDSAVVESWNGTSWSPGTSMPAAKLASSGGCGLETTGLIVGGAQHPAIFLDTVNEYNGTSWAAGGTYPAATLGSGTSGSSSAALSFGGNTTPGRTTATNQYDGAVWTTISGVLTTARNSGGSSKNGTTGAALMFGGTTGSNSNATEEFALAPAAVTFTAS